MGMSFGQHMDMRPSPSLIQFTEILQLSGLEMQAAIRRLADDPAYRNQLAAQGKRVVEASFSEKAMLAATAEAYLKAFERKTVRSS